MKGDENLRISKEVTEYNTNIKKKEKSHCIKFKKVVLYV